MPPKKKIAALVKVQLQAGAATPAPPVGTALGPHGVNIMEFSKAYRAAAEKIDFDHLYTPLEAIKLAKEAAGSKKFNSTLDVAMRLGVDPRKADQMVRGTVNLPHGTGKTARVLVFATGEKAEQ